MPPGIENPFFHPILELGEFPFPPFPTIGSLGYIRIGSPVQKWKESKGLHLNCLIKDTYCLKNLSACPGRSFPTKSHESEISSVSSFVSTVISTSVDSGLLSENDIQQNHHAIVRSLYYQYYFLIRLPPHEIWYFPSIYRARLKDVPQVA